MSEDTEFDLFFNWGLDDFEDRDEDFINHVNEEW